MEFADGVLRIPVRKAWPLSVSRGCPPGNIRVPERYERCVGSRSGAPGGNIGQQPGRWSGPRLVRRDTAFTRRLFTEVFLKGRPATKPALIQCFMSPETVLPKGKGRWSATRPGAKSCHSPGSPLRRVPRPRR
jgi:hypothetical protein